MTDINWKTIGGVSLIGGIIGYIGVWNKERRYRKHLVNKFGVFDAESQFGDPNWKTKVVANNDGKPSPYDGKLNWDISYYTPLGRTFRGDISKDPKRKHEGYMVLINCDNLGGCGDSKRMYISPKLLNLTTFKTMPQVKKAFKKFIDDLFTGKMKCQEGGETLTDETITNCVGCGVYDYGDVTRNGYVCHHHLYTSDRIPPSIVFDDGSTLKTYSCKKHTKEAIWMEENPNDNEYEVGGLTISDSDLIPQVKYLHPRERMMRQRFGLGAEAKRKSKNKYSHLLKGSWSRRGGRGASRRHRTPSENYEIGYNRGMGWGMMGIPSTDTIYYDLSKYSNDTKWIIIRRVGERGNKGYNLGWPVKTDEGYTTKSKWFPTQTKAKEYASKIIISIESPQLWERVQKEGIDDFLLRAETFEAESSLPQAYLMENWEKKNPYEIHVAGCNHGNLAGGDGGHRIFGEASSSIKNVCNVYIGLWQDNFEPMPKELKPSDAEVDAINDMTFSQFMRNKYVKDTVPVKLSPCCKKDVRIKEYCDNALIKDIQTVTPFNAETFEAKSKKTNEMDKFFEWILKEKPTSRQTTKPYSRKVDYLAQRYSDEELKAGLVNAYNAGDIDNAKLFAAAIGRQGFVSKYQAERKVY
tara:strand:- start:99 stop:2009 length:1911 start_codon:yes stop_codon:yes gene_type:complete